jgi:hypothetical protein
MKKTLLSGAFVVVLALGAVSAAEPTFDEEMAAVLGKLPGSDIPVQMHFEGRKLSEILGSMAAAGPFEVTFQDGVQDVVVAVNWMEKQSMKQALMRLAREYGLEYAILGKDVLIVRKRITAPAAASVSS